MFDKKFKHDPKKRFSTRVENYIKYRPSYPQEIISFLKEKQILSSDSVIADIGSGTGILSELFLKEGNHVYGIEPNIDMRNAGETQLSKYSNFVSLEGSAENSLINSSSVDIITAGQAFHWFDLEKTRIEFLRILKPEGWVLLIWNRREKVNNEFLKEYEKFLLKYGTDYKAIEKIKLDFDKFFGESETDRKYKYKKFDNYQIFDYNDLKGRLFSTSYIPLEGHPTFNDMMIDLKKLYEKHQQNGLIKFEYKTEVIYGQLV
ncbi:MAG: SAM-dependent methyltransferase [Promethearchaeota archaeon Loki_b32]|nr:MAG: SAM-dependent methyltransferase [Candidatus Lokiarchaeota archaeon Loki_b32]